VDIKENGDVLIPKLLGNRFIMQNRRLRLDCRATESWLFSFIKLIWEIFIYILPLGMIKMMAYSAYHLLK